MRASGRAYHRATSRKTRQPEQILARQLELGIVPPDTELTGRIDEIPAWDSLPENERDLVHRQLSNLFGNEATLGSGRHDDRILDHLRFH